MRYVGIQQAMRIAAWRLGMDLEQLMLETDIAGLQSALLGPRGGSAAGSVTSKAVTILQGILEAQPFPRANLELGLLIMEFFCEINGMQIQSPDPVAASATLRGFARRDCTIAELNDLDSWLQGQLIAGPVTDEVLQLSLGDTADSGEEPHPDLYPEGEDPDFPVTAYVTQPFASLDVNGKVLHEAISEHLASTLGQERPVKIVDPMHHPGPSETADLNDRGVHHRNLKCVAASDALILLAGNPSSGAGKELDWAERLRLPVLVLHPSDVKFTRLGAGTTGDLTVKSYEKLADVRTIVGQFLMERRGQLAAHAQIRRERQLVHAHTQTSLSTKWDGLVEAERFEVSRAAHLTPDRIEEITSTCSMIAFATVDELMALGAALRVPTCELLAPSQLPPLPEAAEQALMRAADSSDWSEAFVAGLRRRERRELARADGVLREPRSTEDDWVSFSEDLDEGL